VLIGCKTLDSRSCSCNIMNSYNGSRGVRGFRITYPGHQPYAATFSNTSTLGSAYDEILQASCLFSNRYRLRFVCFSSRQTWPPLTSAQTADRGEETIHLITSSTCKCLAPSKLNLGHLHEMQEAENGTNMNALGVAQHQHCTQAYDSS
jgi:hypothetical protein